MPHKRTTRTRSTAAQSKAAARAGLVGQPKLPGAPKPKRRRTQVTSKRG